MGECNECEKPAAGRDHEGTPLCALHMIEAQEVDAAEDETQHVSRSAELDYQATAKAVELNVRRREEGW